MKKQVSIAVCLTFICLAGCTEGNATTEPVTKESDQPANTEKSTNEKDQENAMEENLSSPENPSKTDEDDANNVTLTEEEVIASVKKQLQSSLPPKLPKQLPMSSADMQLSAAIHSENDMYRVIFFESKKTIPVNDEELNNISSAKPIAVIEAKQYETAQEAESKIGYISPEDIQTGNEIDLGHSITGFEEGGAGHKWLNWHEGRWYLQIQANNIEGNNDYVPLAKRMVDYLESNTLPAPDKYGSVKVNVDDQKAEDNRISWQEGTIVYSVSEVADPIKMLEIVTHLEGMEE
ncbi:hypothetical protein CYL18_16570 [Pradoshia eiseniae]|uniref:Uncharacterized protein n=1 Tax=Pradoshia eiseniae TaxID=2064768 RepID=A0A2S7MW70_9BACI|nr:hypothetical protein [Pradoshia eiseniae]PQD93988.1 hypothetical protein CYL18_16570 [Pradoshia eiseniae]